MYRNLAIELKPDGKLHIKDIADPLDLWEATRRFFKEKRKVLTSTTRHGWGSTRIGGNRGGVHRGADIMFARRFRGELADVFPPRAKGAPSPHTPNFFMPPGTLVLAAGDGEVWSAGWTPTGYSVVLSHGAPWASYYTHLASLRVGETRRGASKERVRAGQPLGVVGASPKDARGVAHLHFELWHGGNGNAAIDPEPYLRRMAIVDSPEMN